jgi:hypothetical protein
MTSLREMIARAENLILPFGEIDVLLYYSAIAPYLVDYLRGKEIASKIWLPRGNVRTLLKRGSKDKPLYIEDMVEGITPEFMGIRRAVRELKDAKSLITEKQAIIWSYFVPRKLADFFYATNKEGEGKDIDRVFFDIDRGEGMSARDSLHVTKLLIDEILGDEEMCAYMKGDPHVSWTGASFHVLFDLKQAQHASFHDRYLGVSAVKALDTSASKWLEGIGKSARVPVVGGHAKVKGAISIDPSQTPSGKLCRVPLGSLHMKDATTVDGVSVPLTPDMLDESIIGELESYTPEKILDRLPELAKRLPLRA